MRRMHFQDREAKYTRISKREARILWGKVDIALCPVNFRPGLPYALHAVEQRGTASIFDQAVAEFEYYNCTDTVTGRYAAFYLMKGIKNIS